MTNDRGPDVPIDARAMRAIERLLCTIEYGSLTIEIRGARISRVRRDESIAAHALVTEEPIPAVGARSV